MTSPDSHFGPVQKWGPNTPERRDLFLWDLEVERAMQIVAPGNLAPVDEDMEPTDRGSAAGIGNGLVLGLLFWSLPFAIFGAWTVGTWLGSL
jgi:hypothetical protein